MLISCCMLCCSNLEANACVISWKRALQSLKIRKKGTVLIFNQKNLKMQNPLFKKEKLNIFHQITDVMIFLNLNLLCKSKIGPFILKVGS